MCHAMSAKPAVESSHLFFPSQWKGRTGMDTLDADGIRRKLVSMRRQWHQDIPNSKSQKPKNPPGENMEWDKVYLPRMLLNEKSF